MNSSKSSARFSFSACAKSRGSRLLLMKSSITRESVTYTVRCQGTAIFVSVGAKMPVSKKEVSECPVDAMMRVMDGRWKGTILWRLQDGPRRTSELKRSIPGITERMLIRHLQELVADGIVKRDDKKRFRPAFTIRCHHMEGHSALWSR